MLFHFYGGGDTLLDILEKLGKWFCLTSQLYQRERQGYVCEG